MTILDVQWDAQNSWWVVTFSNGDTGYYTDEGMSLLKGVDGTLDEQSLIGMDIDTFYSNLGTTAEISYNEPPPTATPTSTTTSVFPSYEMLTNEVESQFPSDGGALNQIQGKNWLVSQFYEYAIANPDKAVAMFYLTRDVYSDYSGYPETEPYPLWSWYSLVSLAQSVYPDFDLATAIPQQYWDTTAETVYDYDPITGQVYLVESGEFIDTTTGEPTGENINGTPPGGTTEVFGGQGLPDPNTWTATHDETGTQVGWIDPSGNYWNVDGSAGDPNATYYNADGTAIGTGGTEPVGGALPPGYNETWVDNGNGTFTDPDGNTWFFRSPDGTWQIEGQEQFPGGITGGESPATDTIESLQAQLENGEITEEEFTERLFQWLSENQTAGLSEEELRTLANQYLAAFQSGFAGAAFSALDPDAQLAGQTRDPFRDAAIQFFPQLNLPGQSTLMNARDAFESGFALQGGVPQPEFFTTQREFFEGGGLPLTSAQALGALQNLYGQRSDFLSDPTGFIQNLQNTYGPDQALAFQYSMGQLFDPNNPLQSADRQYSAVFNPLYQNVDPRIAGALQSSFDLMRNTYNAARTDPTQSFFIENFIQPGGIGESLLGAFDEPEGINFLASAFL